ncbi:MAG: hypothetical protein ACI9P7_002266, partial [Candidatus Azotimanducaceae bacterium]
MSNIEAKLRRLKPEVADQFSRVEARLNKLLSNEELAGWGELCWVLADAGWHGWEATNDYVNLSTDLARKPQRLLEVGEYCTTLVGTSFEPGRTYLRGISQLIECDDFRQLPLIDETGKAILDRFQHASNLHTAFFK